MKRFLSALALTLGASAALWTVAAHADADDASRPAPVARAFCAGGPVGPSYAFRDPGSAQACARVIGSQSRDCARFVRFGACRAYSFWDVDAVNPRFCQCNPPGGYVGTWL